MIRFRNPGTQYATQILLIKQLYKELKDQEYFTLDDMAIVFAKNNMMTAYGYSGDQAIELSNTESESLNSAQMNAKMYAEVFRMLGWITPYSEKSSYPLSFTYLGIHVALSDDDCSALYEQCVLGINNPTELTEKMSYNEEIRFFKCALKSLIDLDGIMYKHELCLGHMSVNDENDEEYQKMISFIKSIRGDEKKLDKAFKKLAKDLGMKTTPVDNCTRLPVALMKSCGWIETVKDKTLYNKSKVCIKITQHGIDTYNCVKDMIDLRYPLFMTFDESHQQALIRIGMYRMLERAGYNIESIKTTLTKDEKLCKKIIGDKELLFSPCQTLKRNAVENALGIKISGSDSTKNDISTFASSVNTRESMNKISSLELNIDNKIMGNLLNKKEDIEFLNKVNSLKVKGNNSREIVDILFEEYITSTQTVFYPLVATIFKIMGLKCHFSRPGDNGSRWDAIIEDEARSIPIEIKSPTEEMHLSLKAIRQALENKIILLSRKTYITDKDTTTLAVGYYLPNDRAEVSRLINDIKATYGYKIGVIDFKSILSIAISILVDGRGFEIEKLYSLEGLCNASI